MCIYFMDLMFALFSSNRVNTRIKEKFDDIIIKKVGSGTCTTRLWTMCEQRLTT